MQNNAKIPAFSEQELQAVANYWDQVLRSSIHQDTIDNKNVDFILMALGMMGFGFPLLMLQVDMNMTQTELCRVQVTLADVEVLLNKINPLSLSAMQHELYYETIKSR